MLILPTFRLEQAAQKEGFSCVVGTDEAGSGAWAGPVFAGAALFTPYPTHLPEILRDSKLLSARQRDEAYDWVIDHATSWAVGQASVEEIERLNIRQAGLLAMRRAIEQISPTPNLVLSDGFPLPDEAPWPSRGIIKGDRLSVSIAAASILAKVSRDRFLEELDVAHPGYGFAKHKGYGTKLHQATLQVLGPSPVHRVNYAPIRLLLKNSS